jgi:hypothetical protein
VSAGNCAASGTYSAGSVFIEPFVVTETDGTWGNAQEVPGIGTLNHSQASLNGLSCGSAGNCAVTGSYIDSAGNVQAWLATEVNSAWGNAEEVPGTATLNSLNVNGTGVTEQVSCASAAHCDAAGVYGDNTTTGQFEPFVDNQT